MMVKELADEVVAANREGRERDLVRTHYAPDAVSVEAADMGSGRETSGIEAILGKHDWFEGAFEVHSSVVDGPYAHGDDRFAVIFEVDATERESGRRMPMKEVAVYHVRDGKITREEFFYAT